MGTGRLNPTNRRRPCNGTCAGAGAGNAASSCGAGSSTLSVMLEVSDDVRARLGGPTLALAAPLAAAAGAAIDAAAVVVAVAAGVATVAVVGVISGVKFAADADADADVEAGTLRALADVRLGRCSVSGGGGEGVCAYLTTRPRKVRSTVLVSCLNLGLERVDVDGWFTLLTGFCLGLVFGFAFLLLLLDFDGTFLPTPLFD